MPTPLFPLGVLVAGDPAAAQLRFWLFKAPAYTDGTKVELADLVPVDTAGVEASPSNAWEDPEVPNPYLVRRESKSHQFRCTGTNPGCNALGFAVTCFDGTAQKLILVKKFRDKDGADAPKAMAAPGDNIIMKVDLIVEDARVID